MRIQSCLMPSNNNNVIIRANHHTESNRIKTVSQSISNERSLFNNIYCFQCTLTPHNTADDSDNATKDYGIANFLEGNMQAVPKIRKNQYECWQKCNAAM